jgi:hypothetical protein
MAEGGMDDKRILCIANEDGMVMRGNYLMAI